MHTIERAHARKYTPGPTRTRADKHLPAPGPTGPIQGSHFASFGLIGASGDDGSLRHSRRRTSFPHGVHLQARKTVQVEIWDRLQRRFPACRASSPPGVAVRAGQHGAVIPRPPALRLNGTVRRTCGACLPASPGAAALLPIFSVWGCSVLPALGPRGSLERAMSFSVVAFVFLNFRQKMKAEPKGRSAPRL